MNMRLFRRFFFLIYIVFAQNALLAEATVSIEQEIFEDVYLPAPDLSEENVIGYTVGVRPYRKSGVRLDPEILGDKLIIHNYGYGGSGLTLCWGGAHEALEILKRETREGSSFTGQRKIAILGAGVIGLTTAYELLREGYDVQIYANNFSPNLTSNVAAGIWTPPRIADLSEEKQNLLKRMLAISRERFTSSLNSAMPEFVGIRMIAAYFFGAKANHDNTLSKVFKSEESKEEFVRVHFDNGVTKIGKRKYELGLDGKLFMDDLFTKVIAQGAVITSKDFKTQNEILQLKENIIINCTSFGSRELFNDQDFIPLRGQMVYLKRTPGVDYMMSQNVPQPNCWMTIYPWSDRLLVGGLIEKGVETLEVDPQIVNMLLNNARSCINGE